MDEKELKDRFETVHIEIGTLAGKIKEIVTDTAERLNVLVADGPALLTMLQHLESLLHIAPTAPPEEDSGNPDPTEGDGSPQPPDEPSPQPPDSPPAQTSTPSNSDSEG